MRTIQNLQCSDPYVLLQIEGISNILYNFNVGVTVFGQDSNVPISDIITEFKAFIESNSKLKLNITTVQKPQLPCTNPPQCEEIQYTTAFPGTGGQACYIVTPWSLSDTSKASIPINVQCNFVFWYWENLWASSGFACCGGCTVGGDWGVNNIPFTSMPFGHEKEPAGGTFWKYHLAQVMTHEFLNQLNTVFGQSLGVTTFPSAENCLNLPSGCSTTTTQCFTDSAGWKDCYKYILSTISDSMYIDLQNYKGYK